MPFNFHGPQDIEFLDFLGRGAHSYVFKIRIGERLLTLKVVRCVYAWVAGVMRRRTCVDVEANFD